MRLPEKLFHIHIPKTGGTALSEFLAQFYDEDQVFPPLHPFDIVEQAMVSRDANEAMGLANTRLFTRAHVPYGLYRQYLDAMAGTSEPLTSVCFFRNPLSRSISLVHHLKRTNEADVDLAVAEGRSTPEVAELSKKIIRICQTNDVAAALRWLGEHSGVAVEGYNFYVPQVSFLSNGSKTEVPSEDTLAEAMANFKEVQLVGLVEDNLASLQKVCWMLDLPMPEKDHKANVSPFRTAMTPEISQAAGELNRFDWKLYGEAVSRHYQEMAYVPKASVYNREWAFRQPRSPHKSSLHLPMSGPLYGWGWHVREGGVGSVPFSRWTTDRSVLYVPLAPAQRYQLEITVDGVLEEANLHRSIVVVNGSPVPLKPEHPWAPTRLVATIDSGLVSPFGWTRIDIVPASVTTHETLYPGCGDDRLKGLAISQIALF